MSDTFEFAYDRWCGWLLGLLGHGRRLSRITVDPSAEPPAVVVRMGLAFRATIPRGSIVEVAPFTQRVYGWGVHGWRGRWLVNGSSKGLVSLTIAPPSRARVMGFPIHLRQLVVSPVDPDGLVARLAT
jgi:hypothetical protein